MRVLVFSGGFYLWTMNGWPGHLLSVMIFQLQVLQSSSSISKKCISFPASACEVNAFSFQWSLTEGLCRAPASVFNATTPLACSTFSLAQRSPLAQLPSPSVGPSCTLSFSRLQNKMTPNRAHFWVGN